MRWAGSPVTVCVVCAVVDIGGKRVVVLALVSLTGAVERTRLSEVTPLPLICMLRQISEHVIEELTLVQSARSRQKVFPLEIIFGPLSHRLFRTRDSQKHDAMISCVHFITCSTESVGVLRIIGGASHCEYF